MSFKKIEDRDFESSCAKIDTEKIKMKIKSLIIKIITFRIEFLQEINNWNV